MSEVKIKEGERLEDFEVKGYRQEAHLRSDHAEGGIIVWIKSNKGLNMEVWESLRFNGLRPEILELLFWGILMLILGMNLYWDSSLTHMM